MRFNRTRIIAAPPTGLLLLQLLNGCGGGTAEANPPPPPPAPPVVSLVEVAPASPTAFMGDTLLLHATVKDQRGVVMAGKTVTWSSDKPDVATVDTAGQVVTLASGSVTIRAAVEGKTGSAAVSVTGPATGGGASGSAVVGPSGGVVLATLPGGGSLLLSIPAGALGEPVTVTLDPIVPPAGALAAFRMSPGGLSLAKPAVLVIRVSAGAKVRSTTTLVFDQAGSPIPVAATPNVADGSVTVSLSSLGLPDAAAGGAALRLPQGPLASSGSGSSQGTLMSLALGQRFLAADSARHALQRLGTIASANAMAYAMESVLAIDQVAALADPRFAPLLFDWTFSVCGFTDFALHALQSFGAVSDYNGLGRVIGQYLGWTAASAAVRAFRARTPFSFTCALPVPDAEAETHTKLQTLRVPIINDLNAFAISPAPRDSLFYADRVGPLLSLAASLRLASFDQSAQLVETIVSGQLVRVRSLGYGDCLTGSQAIQARLIRFLAAGGLVAAAASFDAGDLETDIELCGMKIDWKLRDSTGSVMATGQVGGSGPGSVSSSGQATLTGSGNLELGGFLNALRCPSPASSNAEQLEVAAGLTTQSLSRVSLLTPSNQNNYLAVSPLLIPTTALRSAAGLTASAIGTVVVVVRRIGGVCSGLFANLAHSPIGTLTVTLDLPAPCPSPGLGGLANVCQPPPPPPANCPDVRIDTDAAVAAASGETCFLNARIGGFNNRLTVPVFLPQLTHVVEAFGVQFDVPGGLSLPALITLGTGGLFEMDKLATLDLPALTESRSTTGNSGGIVVSNAADLTTIRFGALQRVDGGLAIENNPKLTNISGISCGARITGNLWIRNNPLLSTAAAQALANCLVVTGTKNVSGNMP